MSAAIITRILSSAMQLSNWRADIPRTWVSLHTEEFSSHCEFDALLWLCSCRLKSGVSSLSKSDTPILPLELTYPGAIFLQFLEFDR